MVVVNTLTKKRRVGGGVATDMTGFESVISEAVKYAKEGVIIVKKSTVPCQTAEMVRRTVSPPLPRILQINTFSERAKLVANSMLARRISSINSMSALCEVLGADVDEVARVVGADPRIGGEFLRAGLVFGGNCFRKDVLGLVYMAETLHHYDVAEYWRAVVAMNKARQTRFVRRIIQTLNGTVRGRKLASFEYAFKKNTSDTRESPVVEVIRESMEEELGEIAVFDSCCNPLVTTAELEGELGRKAMKKAGGLIAVYDSLYTASGSADAIVIAINFGEFCSPSKISCNPHPSQNSHFSVTPAPSTPASWQPPTSTPSSPISSKTPLLPHQIPNPMTPSPSSTPSRNAFPTAPTVSSHKTTLRSRGPSVSVVKLVFHVL